MPARAMIFCSRSMGSGQLSVFRCPAEQEKKTLSELFTGGGGFGLRWFFVELAAGHALVGGGDFFFAQEFGVGWRRRRRPRFRKRTWGTRRVGRKRRPTFRTRRWGTRVCGGGQILERVGGWFCQHSLFGGGRDTHVGAESFAGQRFKLLEGWKFLEIAEAEAHEEFFGGFVKNRATHHFLAAGGGDEALVEKGGDDGGGVDAANFGDFRAGDRLLVGDNGQRFQGGHGEAQRRAQALDEAANDVVVLRLGVHLVATGDGTDFDAALFDGVAGDQFVQRRLHQHFFLAQGRGELLDGGRLIGGIDDGFQGGFAFGCSHKLVIEV